jgi:Kef-type K+ transport system membrane component KefB
MMAGGIALLWRLPPVEAMFIAAAMVANSVVITAEVLSRGLLDLRASRAILASVVVDDILGLIVLAVVSGSAQGRMNSFDLILTATLALGSRCSSGSGCLRSTRAWQRLSERSSRAWHCRKPSKSACGR